MDVAFALPASARTISHRSGIARVSSFPCASRCSASLTEAANKTRPQPRFDVSALSKMPAVAAAAMIASFVTMGSPHGLSDVFVAPAHAGMSVVTRLPPIDRSDPDRCIPKSSAIGQANAARDKLLDLRECDLRNQDLSGFDLSGAVMENATFDGSNFKDAQLSKSYAVKASFRGTDFTNAVVDRVNFDGADLTSAVFANAVLSDATFDGAILTDTDWSNSYVGDFSQRAICRNQTLKGENPNGSDTRQSLGCR